MKATTLALLTWILLAAGPTFAADVPGGPMCSRLEAEGKWDSLLSLLSPFQIENENWRHLPPKGQMSPIFIFK